MYMFVQQHMTWLDWSIHLYMVWVVGVLICKSVMPLLILHSTNDCSSRRNSYCFKFKLSKCNFMKIIILGVTTTVLAWKDKGDAAAYSNQWFYWICRFILCSFDRPVNLVAGAELPRNAGPNDCRCYGLGKVPNYSYSTCPS